MTEHKVNTLEEMDLRREIFLICKDTWIRMHMRSTANMSKLEEA